MISEFERFLSSKFFRILVSIVIIAFTFTFLVTRIDVLESVDLIRQADFLLLTAAILLLFVSVGFLETIRFIIFFHRFGIRWRVADGLVLTGLLLANIVGSSVAADAWRLRGVLQLEGDSLAKLSSFIALKVIGLCVTVCIFAIWIVFVPGYSLQFEPQSMAPWGLVAGVSIVLVVLGLAIFRHWRGVVISRLRKIRHAVIEIGYPIIFKAMLISILILFVRAFSISCFLIALGIDANSMLILGVVSGVTLSGIAPLSPANIGVRESVFVALLVSLDYSYEVSLAIGLLDRFAIVFISLFGLKGLLREFQFAPRA